MEVNNINMNLLGPYVVAPEVLKERTEVMRYYNFFYGKSTVEDNILINDNNKGQSWIVNNDLDFKPSQDIRNHIKKIIRKQARFMFGVTPTISFKGYKKEDNDEAEAIRQVIDRIFEENEFWKDTFKAFLDCTIGKRVLIRVEANEGEPITIHYHTMDEFTFEVDSRNYKKLKKVTIAYLEKDTANNTTKLQQWKRWQYEIKEDGYFYLTSGTYDGFCKPIEEIVVNTKFDEIPCKVIINDGLTGDLRGSSDIRDLVDPQDSYNRVNSDYKDALKFKMFEQPVFIDADEESTEDIVIAPNALIDLKSDRTKENSKADAKMLSGSFSFVQAAKVFTDNIKKDLYEMMDQPQPEDLKSIPSGKAYKMTYYDLMGRCDEKWIEWEGALKWVIRFIVKAVNQLQLYDDIWKEEWSDLDFRINIKHNYPIPDDENENKSTAISEINSNVRSIESYIKEFSDEEDYKTEYKKILNQIEDIRNAEQDNYELEVNNEISDISEKINTEKQEESNQDDEDGKKI